MEPIDPEDPELEMIRQGSAALDENNHNVFGVGAAGRGADTTLELGLETSSAGGSTWRAPPGGTGKNVPQFAPELRAPEASRPEAFNLHELDRSIEIGGNPAEHSIVELDSRIEREYGGMGYSTINDDFDDREVMSV